MNERKDIIRTRKAIWQAYLDLSCKKSCMEITASDIIKKANVSRATFYGHYKDIHELRKEIERDFSMMSCEALLPYIRILFTNCKKACYNILLFFEKNRTMLQCVTASGTSESFFQMCKVKMGNDIIRCAYTGKINDNSKLKCNLIAAMIVDQGKEVVNGSDETVTVSIRSEALMDMILHGMAMEGNL